MAPGEEAGGSGPVIIFILFSDEYGNTTNLLGNWSAAATKLLLRELFFLSCADLIKLGSFMTLFVAQVAVGDACN